LTQSERAEGLRAVPLFAELQQEDLERLASGIDRIQLPAGALLFEEGDQGDHAYVIDEGDIEILKITDDREVLIARRGPGEVIGEMALIEVAPRMATARASTDSSLLSIPKEHLDELLATSAAAARALFTGLLARWRETQGRLRQSERMAQLGTLTAGLAHELNNPAAAVQRSAGRLKEALTKLPIALSAAAALASAYPDLRERLQMPIEPPRRLGPLERADLESEIEGILQTLGVPRSWELAEGAASSGMTADTVQSLVSEYGDKAPVVLEALVAMYQVFGLVGEIEEGTSRMSTIIGALKSYSYLDQAPLQNVDVRKGIEDTIVILEHKLKDITVELDLDDMPVISAYGSELNQVWTNLLDNAADAVAGTPDARISIRGRVSDNSVVVEIEDNGEGVPEEALPRIFDAFYTTKPPGSGTGLGLDISYSIVVHRHRGELTVQSRPGRTVFTVSLPTSPPS
jgi:signal transduction histidine kinase